MRERNDIDQMDTKLEWSPGRPSSLCNPTDSYFDQSGLQVKCETVAVQTFMVQNVGMLTLGHKAFLKKVWTPLLNRNVTICKKKNKKKKNPCFFLCCVKSISHFEAAVKKVSLYTFYSLTTHFLLLHLWRETDQRSSMPSEKERWNQRGDREVEIV